MNTKAIISLLLGSVSLVFAFFTVLGLIFAIVGFIIGFLSLKEIHKTNQRGYITAFAGLTCNALAFTIPMIMIIFQLLFLTPADFRLEIS